MAHAISAEPHLTFNLAKVGHKTRPLLFHAGIRPHLISLVAAREDERWCGEGADGLGHFDGLSDSRPNVILPQPVIPAKAGIQL